MSKHSKAPNDVITLLLLLLCTNCNKVELSSLGSACTVMWKGTAEEILDPSLKSMLVCEVMVVVVVV